MNALLSILMVAGGLGFVIFVHELGHFLVAKWCGVKCEKFFIGFDIGGWKISRKWGETEYGIGILPLGGYVKMLGQDDNPYKSAEEMERAKLRPEGPGEDMGAGQAAAESPFAAEKTAADAAETAEPKPAASAPLEPAPVQLDPRSYQAKSVPQRMAIISAGVIMNLIFGVLMATVAYSIGVPYTPAVIGAVSPGSEAWKAGLRPGDEILRVNRTEKPRFHEDFAVQAAYGDPLTLLVQRKHTGADGQPQIEEITLQARPRGPNQMPTIGAIAANDIKLSDKRPAASGSAAADAQPPLEPGDRIVAVQSQAVADYADLDGQLARYVDQPIQVRVQRTPADARRGEKVTPEELDITVPANPKRVLGVVLPMGPIVGVRPGSPAATAGLQAGDLLLQIDADSIGDPSTLPDRLRRRAGETVQLTVKRGEETLTFDDVTLAEPVSTELPLAPGDPFAAPALGIIYNVEHRIAAIEPGSPAADSGKLKVGDVIHKIKIIQPPSEEPAGLEKDETIIELTADEPNWPSFHESLLQLARPDSQIELQIGDDDHWVKLAPAISDEWNSSRRGFLLTLATETRRADGIGEAFYLGARETWESVGMVFGFLRKIGTLWRFAGGPGTIATAAYQQAERGLPSLLIFLTMLSANLAVLNFLPIPVLDGGHFMFLAIEGIRRKPLSERALVLASYLGLFFILGLMVLVISLEINRFVLSD